MNCLECGEFIEETKPKQCPHCGIDFSIVPEIYGVSHSTQLLDSISKAIDGKLPLSKLFNRLGSFMESWDELVEAWELDSRPLTQQFSLEGADMAPFRKVITQIDDTFVLMEDLEEIYSEFEETGEVDLELLHQCVREFTMANCAAAGLFFSSKKKRAKRGMI